MFESPPSAHPESAALRGRANRVEHHGGSGTMPGCAPERGTRFQTRCRRASRPGRPDALHGKEPSRHATVRPNRSRDSPCNGRLRRLPLVRPRVGHERRPPLDRLAHGPSLRGRRPRRAARPCRRRPRLALRLRPGAARARPAGRRRTRPALHALACRSRARRPVRPCGALAPRLAPIPRAHRRRRRGRGAAVPARLPLVSGRSGTQCRRLPRMERRFIPSRRRYPFRRSRRHRSARPAGRLQHPLRQLDSSGRVERAFDARRAQQVGLP